GWELLLDPFACDLEVVLLLAGVAHDERGFSGAELLRHIDVMLGELHLDLARILVGRDGIDHGIGRFLRGVGDGFASALRLFLSFSSVSEVFSPSVLSDFFSSAEAMEIAATTASG